MPTCFAFFPSDFRGKERKTSRYPSVTVGSLFTCVRRSSPRISRKRETDRGPLVTCVTTHSCYLLFRFFEAYEYLKKKTKSNSLILLSFIKTPIKGFFFTITQSWGNCEGEGSLFQTFGSWGRAKKRVSDRKKRERTMARNGERTCKNFFDDPVFWYGWSCFWLVHLTVPLILRRFPHLLSIRKMVSAVWPNKYPCYAQRKSGTVIFGFFSI